jgi:hypothetical protein
MEATNGWFPSTPTPLPDAGYSSVILSPRYGVFKRKSIYRPKIRLWCQSALRNVKAKKSLSMWTWDFVRQITTV